MMIHKNNEEKENKEKKTISLLSSFGKDLTQLAKENKLDPVYGREKEIEDIINILNKRKKNNPILIGESGVGKTAVVEGLAQKIIKETNDVWFVDKKIIELNLNLLVAGTKYRGEFEQRLENLIKELKNNPDIILFIDEIHNLIGSGGTSGSLDGANILKPALSRGEIKCIGTTTSEEYKKYIETESAFSRRFQKVYVSEPSKKEMVKLLENIKYKYEEYHGVKYSKEVIEYCVDVADKYINYKKFPDKAIDLLDETGSMVKLKQMVIPETFKELKSLLSVATKNKEEASKMQDFEAAASWRDEERKIGKELEELNIKIRNEHKNKKIKVNKEHFAKIISIQTGIQIKKLTSSENSKLKRLDRILKQYVIGQDEAVDKVVESIQRSRLGFADSNRPIASFLFLGSTGVGKTYLAKLLATNMFDTNESFVRIDMSEYKESFSISKLIGSPPGYIGHEEKGQLTEKIKNRPYSIVLFDEIEKAHPNVFNVLLQVLDDGKLTDSSGGVVNFKNTIIIMTSNIGTQGIIENKEIGFGVSRENLKVDKDKVIKELEKKFSPEFLNRIDNKIVFEPLTKEIIKKVAKIEIKEVQNRLKSKNYYFEFNEEVVDYVAEKGYDKRYGARPIKRHIENKIIKQITIGVINDKIKENKKYLIGIDKKTEKIIIKDA